MLEWDKMVEDPERLPEPEPNEPESPNQQEPPAEENLYPFGPEQDALSSHAFVVKIWLEEEPGPQNPPLWRGHITNAYTGERRYFQKLDAILEFIQFFLDKSLDQEGG